MESSSINKLLTCFKLKKKYIEKLNNKIYLLNMVKNSNYKKLSSILSKKLYKKSIIILYVISIYFLKKNTMFHISDYKGKLITYFSAGSLKFKGKAKKSRFLVFKHFYNSLLSQLKFLKGKPIALHLHNASNNKTWIINKIKKKFFLVTVKSFNQYPHNGCRKRKVKRKKVRTRKFN